MVPLIREVGVFGHERLRRWARNQQRSLREDVDVMWDPIVAIDETGAFQVYDLTVPRTHNFIANDVCVHNTTFCLNIAQHAALQQKTPVAIFSLESSNEQVVQRMLASEAEGDGSKLRTGFLSDTDWPQLAHAMARLSAAPIFIDDSAPINVIEMRAKARKLKAEHGLGLIIIDYLQMTQSYRRTENRTQEISEIERATKSLANEMKVPVIAISQLSRAVEALGNRRPQLSHLRESGELEQVADLVLFIYREDYYNENTEKKNIAEIIVSKHRNGPTGTIELYFNREHSRFIGLDRRRGGPKGKSCPGAVAPIASPVARRHAAAVRSCAVVAAVLALTAVAASRPPAASADPARPPWLPRRALWIEVSANLPTLSSRDAIRALVARARDAGFDTLIPEAKNAWGFVIHESAFAPHIRTSPVARPFPPAYPPPPEWYPADFDALGVLIEEAHAVGVRVHAAVNVFGEGLVREGVGKAFDRPEWQSVHVMRAGEGKGGRFVPASGAPGSIAEANPAQ